jgi:hypothetical protein
MHRWILRGLLLGAGLSSATADSIIVIEHSQTGLAIAADSRQVDERTGALSDNACKLLALGAKLVFAAAGQSVPVPEGSPVFGAEVQWTYDEARIAFERLQSQSASNPVEAVAKVWKESIQKVLEETFSKYPDSFVQMPQGGYLLKGVFAGLDAKGEISLMQVSVKPKRPPTIEMRIERIIPGERLAHLALGRTEIVTEFSDLRTERARVEAAQRERELATLDPVARVSRGATRLVDLTIGFLQPERIPDQASVGGKIDSMELRRRGEIRWLQRSDACMNGK